MSTSASDSTVPVTASSLSTGISSPFAFLTLNFSRSSCVIGSATLLSGSTYVLDLVDSVEVKPVIVSLTLSTTSSTPSLTSPPSSAVSSIMLSFI